MLRTEAFPDKYVAFDKVLGAVLKHIDDNTYVLVVSDHGVKPCGSSKRPTRTHTWTTRKPHRSLPSMTSPTAMTYRVRSLR
jgi:predicted AlkP superfamily phosphohydrolase/phosphomutase